ncbi:MAG: hypothetical protein NT062_15445 [Proteobacteria bacterium]|nr:hypothetical protein [Pseudomonadota bacterium]
MNVTVAVIAMLAACGSGPQDAPPDSNDTSVPGGPRVVSFGASTSAATELGPVTFTIILVDPDGVADVQAGSLVDVATGGSYGAFTPSGASGAYALTVSWEQFNAMSPIDAPPVDGVFRTVRAQFFDMVGHEATATLQVKLRCSSDLEFARGGSCDPYFYQDCLGNVPCIVTNYLDHLIDGTRLCSVALIGGTCSACSSPGHIDDLDCQTPLATTATCTCGH